MHIKIPGTVFVIVFASVLERKSPTLLERLALPMAVISENMIDELDGHSSSRGHLCSKILANRLVVTKFIEAVQTCFAQALILCESCVSLLTVIIDEDTVLDSGP
mmetsp:Transcript_9841/g.30018  ORF Transcript_9841/g.30018 Transcript_9841/m.30018 type:complete len:105 (-) Transcript_9841:1144-1458(-)